MTAELARFEQVGASSKVRRLTQAVLTSGLCCLVSTACGGVDQRPRAAPQRPTPVLSALPSVSSAGSPEVVVEDRSSLASSTPSQTQSSSAAPIYGVGALPDTAHDPWYGNYNSSGTVKFTNNFHLSESHDLPNRTYCGLSRELMWSCDAVEGDRVAGVHLQLTDRGGSGFTMVSVTLPYGDRLTTFFVRADKPTRWLSLRVGQSSSIVTADGKYRMAMRRTATECWELAVGETRTGGLRAQLTFRMDAPLPPWDRITVDLQGSDSSGSFKGQLRAVRG